MTKVIDGVENRIGYELDFTADELVEAELAFSAQDDEGTVWHMGEYPEEYEEGGSPGTPASDRRSQGRQGRDLHVGGAAARRSQLFPGLGPRCRLGRPGQKISTGSATCVPGGCYDDVLTTAEFNRDEPDAYQLKYYAPGVGNVRVGWAGALEKDQEVLELVTATKLSGEELTKLRATVLEMEKRAYELAKGVYGGTAPMEPPG